MIIFNAASGGEYNPTEIKLAAALKIIFELEYEVEESFFCELTNDQYAVLASEGEEVSSKWYTLISNHSNGEESDVYFVVTEEEKQLLLDAISYINDACRDSKKSFDSYSEKLEYITNILPPIFTESSPTLGRKRHLTIVK
tara:strand:+ start:197 stop:619 length:423 start_codon:yes stop_codon:yes gene_type:complete